MSFRTHPLAALVMPLGVLLALSSEASTGLPWALEFEAAMVSVSRNDVRIPGNTGTRFSLVRDLKTVDDVAFRLRLGRRLKGRHHLSVLYAPLKLHSSGRPGFGITFSGREFAADAHLDAVYKFNSYRATWRYDAIGTDRLDLSVGLTGKIRDASIELSDGETVARKDNVGFVPLVHLKLDWRWSAKLGLLFEADALASAQGRAEDALLAIAFRPWHQGIFRLGYRLLEGGADTDDVYSFATIHYGIIGWTQRF
jgi:hypothetical protein